MKRAEQLIEQTGVMTSDELDVFKAIDELINPDIKKLNKALRKEDFVGASKLLDTLSENCKIAKNWLNQ